MGWENNGSTKGQAPTAVVGDAWPIAGLGTASGAPTGRGILVQSGNTAVGFRSE